MSHFSTIKTVIREQVLLEDTLRELHYSYKAGESIPIRGYRGERAFAQVVVDTGSAYDIGFQRQSDETFSVCSDWWGVEGNSPIRQVEFLRSINQNYTRACVRQQAVLAGHIIEIDRVLENGEIEIVLCERI